MAIFNALAANPGLVLFTVLSLCLFGYLLYAMVFPDRL